MKLHLGCGPNYRAGWLNVDIDSSCADLLHDLRSPLPFESESVSHIYNEHFFEHLTLQEGAAFLKECRRVLIKGGVLRISTPDLRWLIEQYVSGAVDEWKDVDWLPLTPCQLLNEGVRSWGHLFVYDQDELCVALSAAGFNEVRKVGWRTSVHPEMCDMESRPFHRELIVEAA